MRYGRIESDEHENRDGEDQEHQPERHCAGSRTETRRADQVDARDEDGEVLDLDREERHSQSEGFGRRHGGYRSHPPGRLRVMIRYVEETPEAQNDEQTADRRADNPASHGGGASRSGCSVEEGEPRNSYRRAGSEVAECESRGVG